MATEISYKDFNQYLSSQLTCLVKPQTLPLLEALGTVLAHDIRSPFDTPSFNNSAMDGFAVAVGDHDTDNTLTLPIVGQSYAGQPFEGKLTTGQAIRIMTGAAVPAGTDYVVPFEKATHATDDGETVTFCPQDFRHADNIRQQGEELSQGQIAISTGTVLSATHIALAASLGYDKLLVRRPRVGVFSTGSELREPGSALANGQIYDANRFLLQLNLQQWGCQVIDLGILPDDPEIFEAALRKALPNVDVLVTSGGVGEGDKDFTTAVCSKFGEVEHFNIRMRPGRPFTFGRLKGSERTVYLFALPGNPVAAGISAHLFLKPALRKLAGNSFLRQECSATLSTPIKGRTGRTDFVRGTLHCSSYGQLVFSANSRQGSAMLTTLTNSNSVAVLTEDQAQDFAGQQAYIVRF